MTDAIGYPERMPTNAENLAALAATLQCIVAETDSIHRIEQQLKKARQQGEDLALALADLAVVKEALRTSQDHRDQLLQAIREADSLTG